MASRGPWCSPWYQAGVVIPYYLLDGTMLRTYLVVCYGMLLPTSYVRGVVPCYHVGVEG